MINRKSLKIVGSALTMAIMLSGCSAVNNAIDNVESLVGTSGETASTIDSSGAESTDSATDQAIEDRLSELKKEAEEELLNESETADTESDTEDSATAEGSLLEEDKTELLPEGDSGEEMSLSEEEIAQIRSEMDGLYAYSHLNEEGQIIYAEVYAAIVNYYSNMKVSTTREDDLDVVYEFVLRDHPEIFYVSSYHYYYQTLNGEVVKILFSANYDYEQAEVMRRQELIQLYEDACFEGLPADADEYIKVKYVYDYIIDNTDYVAGSEDNQNICSVFINGQSVCNGYAKATQYLLNDLGIESVLVDGTANGSDGTGNHAWNLVKVDGEYYYVDTTWGDASFQGVSGSGDDMTVTNYYYLCCTTEDISKTHTFKDSLPLPDCTSIDANYFVREGLYFTSADMNKVAEIFKNGYESGNGYVTLKCANSEVYNNLYYMLITDKQVFNYLQGTGSEVSYSMKEDQNILMFWL